MKGSLERLLGDLGQVVRAPRSRRPPVVLTREEVDAVLSSLGCVPLLVSMLLYGLGLRLLKALQLRSKDIDFARKEIVVRQGKREKDRVTMFPAAVFEPLHLHLERLRRQHARDLEVGLGRVPLPDAIARKYQEVDRV